MAFSDIPETDAMIRQAMVSNLHKKKHVRMSINETGETFVITFVKQYELRQDEDCPYEVMYDTMSLESYQSIDSFIESIRLRKQHLKYIG
jgi:hypothetical protein